MAVKKGSDRRFYLSSAQHATNTWLDGEQTNSFNRSAETIDVTDKSSEWAQFIAGIRSATADVTVNLDNDSTSAQHDLLESFHDGDTVYCFIGTLGTGSSSSTPEEGDFFEAIITAISETNEKGGVSSRQLSLQVTGEPTHFPTL